MFYLDIPNSRLLWIANKRPENASDFYGFTPTSMMLNQLDESLKQQIPPTDSRLRPDVRLLEEGKIGIFTVF